MSNVRRDRGGPEGILLIDKPQGWTSHDVVAKLRGITGQRRIGHTGTLDPMATGLLVVCHGKATRLVEYMVGHDKRYEGEIVLGVTTDTDDTEGTPIATSPLPTLSAATMRMLESRFSGDIAQRPPAFSAVQVGGERAYAAARRGAPMDLPPRSVSVHSLSLSALAADRLGITVHCGPGTYIRSLARDIGHELGSGGHLARLRRTTAGRFRLDEAWTLAEVERAVASKTLETLLLPADEGMLDHAAAIVTGASATSLGHGAAIPVETREACPVVRVFDAEGTFVGVGGIDTEGWLTPKKVLSTAESEPGV